MGDRLTPSSDVVDFDLHGHVGIRLLDARPDDARRVERQLGPLRSTLAGEPDITVRFVDRIEPRGPLTYAGLGDGGFDDDAFYVLRGRDNVRGKTLVPFQDVGQRCELVCERALPAVPLLLAIVNLTALGKGLVPVHASAFSHAGRGVLASGWAKGGKTELLLAFMARGARYVGDEWIYVTADRQLYGIPEPIRLWRWQLAQLPDLAARLGRRQRLRLAALDLLASGAESVAGAGRRSGRAGSLFRRGAPLLRRQVNVQVPPARLFGSRSMAVQARLDQLVLVSSHERAVLRADPISGAEVAHRMVASNIEERQALMGYYRQFRFAFPDRSSPAIEQAAATEARLLEAAFDGLPAIWLRHPYPPRIDQLYEVMSPLLALDVSPPGD